ncbi:hypothetical protein PVK06_005044 [Gossypium arboreum]|uniref:Aminotransferase-like plant mobile domain-containing protein n=1 Tax=Gossypium arboreum TaxID=29729 RepID=A0ABR0QUT9_GOSAR|nr:hypothetical protein PVK06_005044 [Gossypium arboreum]
MFDLWYELISALVKQWLPETQNFHLSWREYTITLKDVALQLGLPIDRCVITDISTISDSTAFCYNLLGVSLGDDESKFTGLRFSWLKDNFEHLSINATKQEVMCFTRAHIMHIMHIIGGVLMPDVKNKNVHLMYSPLLTGLHNVHSYS